MLVLDENLPADQRQLLRKRRIRFRVVGGDVAASGATDENLIPVLHRLPQPTFFTLDRDFFRADWAHANYCLVWLDVRRRDAAELFLDFCGIRRLTRRRGGWEQLPAFTPAACCSGVSGGGCRNRFPGPHESARSQSSPSR